mmetsp:Transcript_35512/g.35716  ORF Transcript_35512/g.35716 Transcript_35512/m.35716 type:complete len:108 (-) Transcript_35512:204-527(-)
MEKFTSSGTISSIPNTKSLQFVSGTNNDVFKFAWSRYYKYRSAHLMFGFNSGIMHGLKNFCEFHLLQTNQFLWFYDLLKPDVGGLCALLTAHAKLTSKYHDYYLMSQ